MNKELEELDRENWELLSAVKYFREAHIKLREENKQLRSSIQELERNIKMDKDELFKQLAHKTQECERLKYDNDYQVGALERTIDNLKTENEKLKNKIEACYNQVEDFDIIATSKSNKLKQAEQKLEQIKNICHRKADGLWSQTNPLKEILQIIGEVE